MKARKIQKTRVVCSCTRLAMLAAMPALVGCQIGPKIEGPVRAVWVTRMDYKSPQDVSRIMDNCKDAGFNTVLFQVRGNGTVFYPSEIEPWAEQFDFKDPGFDPLQLAIDEAHDRDMELHAWVNVMPAWKGPNPPPIPNQLYNAHPDWFWYDRQGNRQPMHHKVGDRERSWYVSLNPCLPEVREYLVEVFEEIVDNYDVDGLHMDYIRFPNERVVPGEVMPDYPYDERTLALFKEATGETPDSNPDAWNQWRTDQVTQLVSDVHEMMRDENPRAVLSSAAGSVRERALHHFQDARAWMERGVIDAVFLMNYTPDVDAFSERIDPWLEIESDAAVIPGMMVRDNRPDAHMEDCKQIIETAREKTGHFCVFAYSSLFDSRDDELATQDSPARQRRAARRESLIPFLQSLAVEDDSGGDWDNRDDHDEDDDVESE